jgi:pimeloyl-ACP methyl ester carboxylesterase
MTSQEHPELLLLSGLAADASIFDPQKDAFPELRVLEWEIPSGTDTLDSYSRKLAEQIETQEGTIIGGASFGGIVAQHMAEHVNPVAVILIGSIRSPSELPFYARAARPLRWLVPFLPIRLLQFCAAPFASRAAQRIAPHIVRVIRQFRGADATVIKWSLARVLDWKTVPQVNCPVFHIHGRRDFVLPARYTSPDRFIERGRHVISLTHPEEVNEFIRELIGTTQDDTNS